MVNTYLRLRISKIQRNIFHVTKSDGDNPSRMTPEVRENITLEIVWINIIIIFTGGWVCFELQKSPKRTFRQSCSTTHSWCLGSWQNISQHVQSEFGFLSLCLCQEECQWSWYHRQLWSWQRRNNRLDRGFPAYVPVQCYQSSSGLRNCATYLRKNFLTF